MSSSNHSTSEETTFLAIVKECGTDNWMSISDALTQQGFPKRDVRCLEMWYDALMENGHHWDWYETAAEVEVCSHCPSLRSAADQIPQSSTIHKCLSSASMRMPARKSLPRCISLNSASAGRTDRLLQIRHRFSPPPPPYPKQKPISFLPSGELHRGQEIARRPSKKQISRKK
jgi:hypothetical protein